MKLTKNILYLLLLVFAPYLVGTKIIPTPDLSFLLVWVSGLIGITVTLIVITFLTVFIFDIIRFMKTRKISKIYSFLK